jgi:hypothetical protein
MKSLAIRHQRDVKRDRQKREGEKGMDGGDYHAANAIVPHGRLSPASSLARNKGSISLFRF